MHDQPGCDPKTQAGSAAPTAAVLAGCFALAVSLLVPTHRLAGLLIGMLVLVLSGTAALATRDRPRQSAAYTIAALLGLATAALLVVPFVQQD